ncbi:zf-HC2 domain-containing protein [Granulicella sp. dw_53]|uniref:anti-sigma factor family protein n=1 Tax=Granulicella sp. dw_53 TaxID=2719792 RepID=UPI001BD377A6|nr:zf-HC2 domain-containing protein [Granulicella sp. dw_53]
MNPCNEHSVDILRYLGNELGGNKLEEFDDHLQSCPDCRAHLQEEQALSRLIRESRPLYSAPVALRARVSAILVQHPSSNPAPVGFFGRLMHTLGEQWRGMGQLSAGWKVLSPALVVAVLCLIFVPDVVRQVRAASYVKTALEVHRSYLDGNLPLEIQSDSPEAVTAWFADKVSFPFRLPTSQVNPEGKPAYRLMGARLVNYKGGRVALVTYGTEKESISLLVAPSQSAVVAGGDEVRSGRLVFHYRSDAGFNVTTWSNRGLAYALVSNISGSARGSCLVCHQSMTDRDAFRSGS